MFNNQTMSLFSCSSLAFCIANFKEGKGFVDERNINGMNVDISIREKNVNSEIVNSVIMNNASDIFYKAFRE